MKKVFAVIIISLFVFFILSNAEAKTQAQQAKKEKILLKSRTIEVEKGKIQPMQVLQQSTKKHILLQLDHIPSSEEKQRMAADGIMLLDYIPDKAWLAYVSNPALSSYNVTYSGDILPEDKMSEYLLSNSLAEIADINVMFFSDTSHDDMTNILNKYGNAVSGYENRWVLRTSPDNIRQLASEDSIKWVEYVPAVPMIMNDGSRATESVDIVQLAPYGLNGTNVVVAEWDEGHANHTDFNSRVIIGDTGTYSNHSTHVAGTMLGNGSLSGSKSGTENQWRGMAPNATLISYEWWNDADELITEYNASINTYNATISQNSWGLGPSPITNATCSAVLGNYYTDTDLVDNVTRGTLGRKISTVWAAGNDRSTNSAYCGSLGFTYWTVTPYGTAKNTITVGAVTKTEAMSTFSSWGPTDDGRIKPDVVAAGVSIKSTYKNADLTDTYATFQGTSMAAPAVSGIIALMQQDYKNYYNATPMPSTAKAILVHTAKDLNETGPDYTTGWGLVNATRAINKLREDNASEVIIEANVSNGQNKTYTFSNTSVSKVTLVWDDYPGTANAATELVNNLDLVVYSPSGSRIFPWTLNANAPHLAAVQNQIDSINNVEQVYVAYTEWGTWTVIVNGTSVPQAPQSFSLVLDNSSNFMPNITQPAIAPTPAYKNSTLNGSAIASDVNNDNMSVYFKWYKNSVNIFNHTFNAVTNGTNVTALLTNGNFSKYDNITLEAFANDTTSNSTFRNSSIQIQNSAPDISLTAPLNHANISSRNVTLIYSATDNDTDTITYYVFINGVLNITTSATSSDINFSDGSYNWTIIAGDNSANATSTARFFTVDTTGPNITLSSPQNRTYNYTLLMLNYTASDALLDKCWYINVTGTKENFSSCSNLSFSAIANQLNNITLYANDTLNNTNSTQIFFSIDTALPIINISSPLNQTYNYTPSLNFTVSNDFDKCWYTNATGARTNISSCNNLSSVNASEGFNNITLYANDTAGNLNFSSVNFTIDFPPTINLSQPRNITYTSRNVSLNFTVSSNFDRCWLINSTGGRINLTSCQNATFVAVDGLNNVTFNVNDSHGSANSTQIFFTVDVIIPSVTFQGQTPNNETLNNTKYIFVNVTTDTADVLLEWNSVNETMTNVSSSKTLWYKNKTISAIGNYTFRVWANDSVNNTNVSETRWVYINDTVNPTLNVTSPTATTYSDSSIALSFNADDNIGLDKCWYSLNGANTTLASCSNATITAQSGSNTLILAINDTANNRNETNVTFTYTPPAAAATTSSSGGGGGGGAAPSAKQTNIISKITPAAPAVVSININDVPVSRITIETKESVNDVRLVTEKLGAKPAGITEPSAKVFKYLNITSSINSSSISVVKIRFSVNRSWVTGNNFSATDIFLLRYSNNAWDKLKTKLVSDNTTFHEYEAESPGFSVFAVSGEKEAPKTNIINTTNISNITNVEPNATKTETITEECKNATTYATKGTECAVFNTTCVPRGWSAVSECPKKDGNAFIYALIIIIIVIVLISIYFHINAHAFEKQSFSMSQRPLVFADFQACDKYMVNQRFTCIGGT